MNSILLKSLLSIMIALLIGSCCTQSSKTENTDAHKPMLNLTINDSLQKVLLDKGTKITNLAGKSLKKSLQNAIQKDGLEYAIDFCNVKAIPITDSVSQLESVQIKRVSDKYRNPLNEPNSLEKDMLQSYANDLYNDLELKPVIHINTDGNPVYFNPIIVGALCLNCHGEVGKTVNSELAKVIKTHYPQDKATGYNEGQLRGMWVITFNGLKVN